MAESNLDDLILTEPEGGGNRKKGLLVMLGLVILLAIIGVVLTNLIMNSNSENNATNTSVKDEIVQDIQNNKIVSKEDNLDDDLAPLDEKDNFLKDENQKDNTKDIITGASVVAVGAVAANKIMKNKENKNVEKNKIINNETLKEKKIEHKKTIRKIVRKEIRREEPRRNINKHPKVIKKSNYSSNIYIQVGSFSKGPAKDFINKIRRAGFSYRIKEVNGFRRVLVGPFRNESEARRVLPRVRAYISNAAFIKR